MRWLTIVLIYLFAGSSLSSQINVTGGFHSDTIVIGDVVDFTLTIRMPSSYTLVSVDATAFDSLISAYQTQLKVDKDSLEEPIPVVADFMLEDWGKWNVDDARNTLFPDDMRFDTTYLGNNVLLENTFRFRIWEPGMQYLKLPEIKFQFRDSVYIYPSFNAAYVFVKPPFALEALSSDTLDIAPIKTIIKEEKTAEDYLIFILLVGAFLLIYLSWFILKNRKKKEVLQKEIVIIKDPPHKIALQKLHALKDQKLWQKGEIKLYQSELTYIIREYLENRYTVPALESTTDEILVALQKKEFDKSYENKLREILQVADLVKFAKAQPELSIHDMFLEAAFDFVRNTIKEESATDIN